MMGWMSELCLDKCAKYSSSFFDSNLPSCTSTIFNKTGEYIHHKLKKIIVISFFKFFMIIMHLFKDEFPREYLSLSLGIHTNQSKLKIHDLGVGWILCMILGRGGRHDRITRQIIDIFRQKKVFCELKSKTYSGDTFETLESRNFRRFFKRFYFWVLDINLIVLLDFINNEYKWAQII